MAGINEPKTLVILSDRTDKEPFTVWLESLKDAATRRRIISRLRRLEQGNFGDCKYLRDGIFELRLFFGSGYRIYYGRDGENIIVLLAGGDKGKQDKDIQIALRNWKEYKSNAQT